jgi:hypothetical protein
MASNRDPDAAVERGALYLLTAAAIVWLITGWRI